MKFCAATGSAMNMEILCPAVHLLCLRNENLSRENTKGSCHIVVVRDGGFVFRTTGFLRACLRKVLIMAVHIVA